MDAKTSRYHEIYARWQRDPQGFWGEAAADIDWYRAGRKPCSIPTPAFTAAGSPAASATPAGTRSTATSRAAAASRSRDHLRLPGHQHQAEPITYAELQTKTETLAGVLAGPRRRQGRPRHPLHADGAGGGDGDARLRAHRRHPFGGVRRLRAAGARHPHRRRQAQGRSCPRRCGIELNRVIAYKPLLDEAIELARHKPQACLILQRPQADGDPDRRPRPRLGRRHADARRAGARPCSPCRSRPPIRSTSSTPRARPASPRAWCATTAATWSR